MPPLFERVYKTLVRSDPEHTVSSSRRLRATAILFTSWFKHLGFDFQLLRH